MSAISEPKCYDVSQDIVPFRLHPSELFGRSVSLTLLSRVLVALQDAVSVGVRNQLIGPVTRVLCERLSEVGHPIAKEKRPVSVRAVMPTRSSPKLSAFFATVAVRYPRGYIWHKMYVEGRMQLLIDSDRNCVILELQELIRDLEKRCR
jgi:hypothetical protein